MSTHPTVPYDPALVAEVATRLDLRAPNAAALEQVARRFDDADGAPFEAVCDIATAVGKTYLAAGMIEYLAEAGVRNILIVVPGSTILNKTVANFTEGHAKSLTGAMTTAPLVVTADSFATGRVASALSNDDQVKLFIFTVQSLIRPKQKTSRKVRKHQEWLGTGLYQHLQAADDLVIIADEHHVYTEKAKTFHAAVRDLDPMGVIGLTATPNPADRDKVIYNYPLAQAIADEYVKTPVLVGRKDQLTDVDVQLRDGLRLLDAKQAAADAYADATGRPTTNAVLFVVADTIDNANAIYETLRKPDLLGEQYDEQVLVIHSDAPDDALARLDRVEQPDSKVRVIVSVSMLKEGWDVKNIYVICSFRPSVSEALTEQTLGRGLRLPWGTYTGIELLDTVEVLSHERYAELLERADVLIEGLTGQRTTPTVTPVATYTETAEASPSGTQQPDHSAVENDLVAITVPPQTSNPSAGARSGTEEDANQQRAPLTTATGAQAASGTTGCGGTTGMLLAGTTSRTASANSQVQALSQTVTATERITIPKLERTIVSRTFSLSDIDDAVFRQLGQRLAADGGTQLDRKVLGIIEDPTQPNGLRLVPRSATDQVIASSPNLPFPEARQRLIDTVLHFDEIPQTRSNINAAGRLADALIEGAGTEAALAAQFEAVLDALRVSIRSHYRSAPAQIEETWSTEVFAPARLNNRPEQPNRYGRFSTAVAYGSWTKSLHALNWFDSEPERRFANLVDDDTQVELWARIQRGELTIPWEGGRYHPDFYVRVGGDHYLVEVKAQNALSHPDVQAKREAARSWARKVTDDGNSGTWHYLLVGEDAVSTASTFSGLSKQGS